MNGKYTEIDRSAVQGNYFQIKSDHINDSLQDLVTSYQLDNQNLQSTVLKSKTELDELERANFSQ